MGLHRCNSEWTDDPSAQMPGTLKVFGFAGKRQANQDGEKRQAGLTPLKFKLKHMALLLQVF